MVTKMDKQEFKEMMAEAKWMEQEHVNMADVANIPREVEKAVRNDTGKEITRLVEGNDAKTPDKPKRKYTRRQKQKATSETTNTMDDALRTAISCMRDEADRAILQAQECMARAELAISRIEALEDMIE